MAFIGPSVGKAGQAEQLGAGQCEPLWWALAGRFLVLGWLRRGMVRPGVWARERRRGPGWVRFRISHTSAAASQQPTCRNSLSVRDRYV